MPLFRINRPYIQMWHPNAIPPARQTDGASGFDVHASLGDTPVVLNPGERVLIPLGFGLSLPPGLEAQIRGRSGLAFNHGIMVALGTIDSDYRGPVAAIVYNIGTEAFTIKDGMRIAQMVLASVHTADLTHVETLSKTSRGSGGFGSTGL